MSLDVDALTEQAARASFDKQAAYYETPDEWTHMGDRERSEWLGIIGAALAVIVPAVTAEVRALHKRVPLHNLADECACPDPDEHEIGYDENGESICLTEDPLGWICAECYRDDGGLDDPVSYPCETVRLLDQLDATVRGERS